MAAAARMLALTTSTRPYPARLQAIGFLRTVWILCCTSGSTEHCGGGVAADVLSVSVGRDAARAKSVGSSVANGYMDGWAS